MRRVWPAEYSIVTDLAELERQGDLQEFLTACFPIFVRADRSVIFDLRRRAAATRPASRARNGSPAAALIGPGRPGGEATVPFPAGSRKDP